MNVAYVDISVSAAIAFGESGTSTYAELLDSFSRLLSSNPLETELRAAFLRENLVFHERAVAGIEWAIPERTLSPELATVLDTGCIRGADLWHVAVALYVSPRPEKLCFLTLDEIQDGIPEELGFRSHLGQAGPASWPTRWGGLRIMPSAAVDWPVQMLPTAVLGLRTSGGFRSDDSGRPDASPGIGPGCAPARRRYVQAA